MSTTETDQVFILIQEILSQKLLPAKKNKFLNSITRATMAETQNIHYTLSCRDIA